MSLRRSPSLSLALAAALAIAPLPVCAQESVAAPATQASLPLAPGEAAGVEKAQGFSFDRIPWVFIAGFGIVLVAVLLAVGDSDSTSTTATD